MSRRATQSAKLPPPTQSEAEFEALLASFGQPAQPAPPADQRPKVSAEETPRELVARLLRDRRRYLADDPYRSIGSADSFYSKVLGVSFEGRQDVLAALHPGDRLTLEREPQNAYDPNAIAVRFGNLQVGYIRKEIAKQIAPLIDAGAHYRARVEEVTGGGDGRSHGVNIFVSRQFERSAGLPAAATGEIGEREVQKALIGDNAIREPQREVLAHIAAGRNVLAIFGTGRGKSFCFQYSAALDALRKRKKTLVLYPLRSLANDQHDVMKRRLAPLGIRILRANGAVSGDERGELTQALADGTWDVMLGTPEFVHFHLDRFSGESRPHTVVIDEVHHLYESRHRPVYGRIPDLLERLGNPQVVGLTATARDETYAHVVNALGIESTVIDRTVRENLEVVEARGTSDKRAYLLQLFARGEKGIVYCNSRRDAATVAGYLEKAHPGVAVYYHAGLASGDRTKIEDMFRAGELQIVVATSAFGEGIDLADVRHVVLYHLNFSFTEFNQQAGRAGRDGKTAFIHLLFGEKDRSVNEWLLERTAPSLEVLRELYRGMRALCSGAMLRMNFTDVARTLEISSADTQTVRAAVQIFEEAGLVESGRDDDGEFVRFLPAVARVDLTQTTRFAEGVAERENFRQFCDIVLGTDPHMLQQLINRPIYPQKS